MSLRIGIDLGGTKIEAVLMARDGAIRETRRVPTPRGDYDATLAAVAELVATLDERAGAVCPVGVGTPGAWVPGRREMKNCNSTWLNGRPLLDDLVARLGARVRIANDANCFALSEARAGAGAGAANVFGVILGTGVGGGWVIRGELVVGANAVAGEWGHTPLPYLRCDVTVGDDLRRLEDRLEDRDCYCGRRNCVETFLSGPGLARTCAALFGGRDDAAAIAARDDAEARATLDLYQAMLARSLAQVVNVLDPDVIVLGGGVSNVKRIYDDLPARMARYGFSHEEATRVVPAAFGDSSGVRGAAWLHGV